MGTNLMGKKCSEVEDILSGKVLDTDIPGLEELMSTESKIFILWDTRRSYKVSFITYK